MHADLPTADLPTEALEGGCACRHVRYRIEVAPIIVHCCHAAGASGRAAARSW